MKVLRAPTRAPTSQLRRRRPRPATRHRSTVGTCFTMSKRLEVADGGTGALIAGDANTGAPWRFIEVCSGTRLLPLVTVLPAMLSACWSIICCWSLPSTSWQRDFSRPCAGLWWRFSPRCLGSVCSPAGCWDSSSAEQWAAGGELVEASKATRSRPNYDSKQHSLTRPWRLLPRFVSSSGPSVHSRFGRCTRQRRGDRALSDDQLTQEIDGGPQPADRFRRVAPLR